MDIDYPIAVLTPVLCTEATLLPFGTRSGPRIVSYASGVLLFHYLLQTKGVHDLYADESCTQIFYMSFHVREATLGFRPLFVMGTTLSSLFKDTVALIYPTGAGVYAASVE